MSESIYDEAADRLTADEFVPVTIHVHVDDLASFHAAVGEWWQSVDGKGVKGRMRIA